MKQTIKNNTMNTDQFIKEVIKVFAEKTSCNIQSGGCPCNSCFHSIGADFNHICWLMLLGLRRDYKQSRPELLEDIKKELYTHG